MNVFELTNNQLLVELGKVFVRRCPSVVQAEVRVNFLPGVQFQGQTYTWGLLQYARNGVGFYFDAVVENGGPSWERLHSRVPWIPCIPRQGWADLLANAEAQQAASTPLASFVASL